MRMNNVSLKSCINI